MIDILIDFDLNGTKLRKMQVGISRSRSCFRFCT